MPKVYKERRCFTYRNVFTLRNTSKMADAAHRPHPMASQTKAIWKHSIRPTPGQNKGQGQGGLPQTVLPNCFPLEGAGKMTPFAGMARFSCQSRAPRHGVGCVEEQPGQAPCSTHPSLSPPPTGCEGRPPSLAGI